MPRRSQPDKNLASRTARTHMTQILNEGFAHLLRQRQLFESLTFAAHEHLAAFPVQIVHGHGEHFATAQTQSSQKQQDRVVALAGRRGAVAAFEQSLDLLGRK